MPEFIDVWEVYETTSEFGERGRTVGFFTEEKTARQARTGRGWYGGEGGIGHYKAVRLEDHYYLLANPLPLGPTELNVDLIAKEQELKENALAKLSTAEKKVLGLLK